MAGCHPWSLNSTSESLSTIGVNPTHLCKETSCVNWSIRRHRLQYKIRPDRTETNQSLRNSKGFERRQGRVMERRREKSHAGRLLRPMACSFLTVDQRVLICVTSWTIYHYGLTKLNAVCPTRHKLFWTPTALDCSVVIIWHLATFEESCVSRRSGWSPVEIGSILWDIVDGSWIR